MCIRPVVHFQEQRKAKHWVWRPQITKLRTYPTLCCTRLFLLWRCWCGRLVIYTSTVKTERAQIKTHFRLKVRKQTPPVLKVAGTLCSWLGAPAFFFVICYCPSAVPTRTPRAQLGFYAAELLRGESARALGSERSVRSTHFHATTSQKPRRGPSEPE